MIIVVPVSVTDDEVVDDFIRVFNLFGPYENHELVVVSRPADHVHGRRVYRDIKDNKFKKTMHWSFDVDGRRGWPGGPNHYWLESYNFLRNEYGNTTEPWLFLEMDMTPIKKNWADELEKEWTESDKPFMGNLSWTTTTTEDQEIINLCQHLVGAAIYPPNLDEYSKIYSKVVFRTCNYKRYKNEAGKYIVQGEDREQWPDPNYTFSHPINVGEAVLIHGCNDGSLARLVYEDITGEKIDTPVSVEYDSTA